MLRFIILNVLVLNMSKEILNQKGNFFKFLAIFSMVTIISCLILSLISISTLTNQMGANENIAGMGPGFKIKTGTSGGMIIAAVKALRNPTPEPLGDPSILDAASSDDGSSNNGGANDGDASGDDTGEETKEDAFTGVGCLVDC